MSQLTASPAAPAAHTRSAVRTAGRWLVSFAGFPLGGLTAMVVTGPVDSTAAALTGGLLTGAVLGAVQAWALRLDRRHLVAWVLATALGLAVGLAVGASVVGFGTSLADLALQGALSGAAVGTAQALVLRRLAGRPASWLVAWPAYLTGAWTLGWVVTTSIGVQVEDQFTVFGSAGALTVTALTSVLPVLLARTRR